MVLRQIAGARTASRFLFLIVVGGVFVAWPGRAQEGDLAATNPSTSAPKTTPASTPERSQAKTPTDPLSSCAKFTSVAVDSCSASPEGSTKREKVARILTQILSFGASSATGGTVASSLANACQSALPTVDAAADANSEMGKECLDSIASCEDRCQAEIEASRKAGQQERMQAAVNSLKTCTDQTESVQKFFTQADYFRNARKRIVACLAATGAGTIKAATTEEKSSPVAASGPQAPTGISTITDRQLIAPPTTENGDRTSGPEWTRSDESPTARTAGAPELPNSHPARMNGSGASSSRPRAYRFNSHGQAIELLGSTSGDGRSPARIGGASQAKQDAPFKSFPVELEEGGGGGGGSPLAAPILPSFYLKREEPGKPLTRTGAEAAFCSAMSAAGEAQICKSPHEAICQSNRSGIPLEIHAEPIWQRLRFARRKFFDNNTIALRQVLGPKGPSHDDSSQTDDSTKDRVVLDYAIQATIDAESLARGTKPEPANANRELLDVFIFNLWNVVRRILPPPSHADAVAEHVRGLVATSITKSEANATDKSRMLKQIGATRVATPEIKARPQGADDIEHLAAYVEYCGLAPLASNAVFSYRHNVLFICPNLFQEGVASPPFIALIAHEFGHAVDAESLRDPAPYQKYLSCLRRNADSPLFPGHTRFHKWENESIADFWMSRALAISARPLFMSADKKLSTRLLRRTMGFLCEATPATDALVDELAQPPVKFRVGDVFGRDAWVRWQLGCADPCKTARVCTLNGSEYDGERRPQ